MARHIIYLEWPLARNAGGPSGYLWHLQQGLKRADTDLAIDVVIPDPAPPSGRIGNVLKSAVDACRGVPAVWRHLKSYGPTHVRKEYLQFTTASPADFYLPPQVEARIAADDVASLHCHTTLDAVRADNSLRRLGIRDRVRLLLTSHCPEMPALEKTDVMMAAGLLPAMADDVRSKLLQLDLHAFRVADLLVFPCEQAMEPYFDTCSDFRAAMAGKEIAYLFSGVEDVPRPPRQDAPRPDTPLKLVYVGRHNAVKGYDLLIDAATAFLDRHPDAVLHVAGKEGPLFAPRHPRWLEAGWVSDPRPLIASGDVFLLPNKRTYFDLVALEVMALGVPILASATGGNKALAELSAGVELFVPTAEGLCAGLEAVAAMDRSELHERGRINRDIYEKHFTNDALARRYIDMLMALPEHRRSGVAAARGYA